MNTESHNPPNQPDAGEDLALDALLKQSAPLIDDAGFTASVMATLPQRPAQPVTAAYSTHTSGLLRKIVLAGSSAIGLILAAFYLPWQGLGPLWNAHQPDTNSAEAWLAVLTVLASLAWTATNALSDEPETL
jgi:hypothetical protein